MNYLELSIEESKNKTYELYKEIEKKYSYDLVIFIAKGAYIIGETLSNIKQVPLLEICATRKGKKIKKMISPILHIFPDKFLIKLRELEMKLPYHEKNSKRNVYFDKEIYSKYKDKVKRILLVDDSIDSGNSIKETRKILEEFFYNSEIKIAVLNVMKKSNIKPDFYIYEDTIINGPWSIHSIENEAYINSYKSWKENYIKKTISISVAMATYNGEDFLEEQLNSIIQNLEENDELIISDDGSTDRTLDILNKYAKSDKRIKLLTGPQKGFIKNFENALKYCTKEYIFLSDQDDIWISNKRNVIISYFLSKKPIAIIHDALVVDKNGEQIINSWYKYRNTKKGIINNVIKNRFLGCCMAFDRKLLKQALPIPNISMHDWWLGLCAQKYGKIEIIEEKLIKYRRHDKNVSNLIHDSIIKMISNRLKLVYHLIIK